MNRSDIPFNADDAHAFLPWIIGIMVCLAALLLCFGVTAGGWIVDRHAVYANGFTVNIPAGLEDAAAKRDKVTEALKRAPGVTRVERVEDAKLKEMLKPWLGDSEAVTALPLPMVLEVTTAANTSTDYKTLENSLAAIAPGTEIDAHELWVASFASFSRAVQWVLGGIAMMIIAGLAMIIAFTSRAALKLHAKTVQLLHSIGAEDQYITRQFQREAFYLTLRGTVPGCVLAAAAYWGAGLYVTSLQSSVLPSLSMAVPHIVLLLALPLACGSVAWGAARASVQKQLQHVL